MIKLLQAIALASLTLSMIGCANSRDTPQLNPHPKHFLTIKGYIAPELKGKVYLAFVQYYAENNDKCAVVTNWLAGSKGLAAKDVVFIPKPNKQGKYVVKIPLDKYLPGECEWASWNMGYSLTSSAKDPVNAEGFVEYEQHTQLIPKFYNLVCHSKPNDCRIHIPEKSYADVIINPNQSSTINLNLLDRKEK